MKRHAIACLCLVFAGCSTEPKKETAAPEPQKKTVPNPLGTPDVYKARFVTSKGPFVIEVHREWAPRGADHFYELIKEGYYNKCSLLSRHTEFCRTVGSGGQSGCYQEMG